MQVVVFKSTNPDKAAKMRIASFPTEVIESMGIIKAGERVTPKGLPFKVMESGDIPYDSQEEREAWDIPESELTDGVGK